VAESVVAEPAEHHSGGQQASGQSVSADAIMQLIVGLALLVGVGLGMHVRHK
jgi:hypothetical protein